MKPLFPLIYNTDIYKISYSMVIEPITRNLGSLKD